MQHKRNRLGLATWLSSALLLLAGCATLEQAGIMLSEIASNISLPSGPRKAAYNAAVNSLLDTQEPLRLLDLSETQFIKEAKSSAKAAALLAWKEAVNESSNSSTLSHERRRELFNVESTNELDTIVESAMGAVVEVLVLQAVSQSAQQAAVKTLLELKEPARLLDPKETQYIESARTNALTAAVAAWRGSTTKYQTNMTQTAYDKLLGIDAGSENFVSIIDAAFKEAADIRLAREVAKEALAAAQNAVLQALLEDKADATKIMVVHSEHWNMMLNLVKPAWNQTVESHLTPDNEKDLVKRLALTEKVVNIAILNAVAEFNIANKAKAERVKAEWEAQKDNPEFKFPKSKLSDSRVKLYKSWEGGVSYNWAEKSLSTDGIERKQTPADDPDSNETPAYYRAMGITYMDDRNRINMIFGGEKPDDETPVLVAVSAELPQGVLADDVVKKYLSEHANAEHDVKLGRKISLPNKSGQLANWESLHCTTYTQHCKDTITAEGIVVEIATWRIGVEVDSLASSMSAMADLAVGGDGGSLLEIDTSGNATFAEDVDISEENKEKLIKYMREFKAGIESGNPVTVTMWDSGMLSALSEVKAADIAKKKAESEAAEAEQKRKALDF